MRKPLFRRTVHGLTNCHVDSWHVDAMSVDGNVDDCDVAACVDALKCEETASPLASPGSVPGAYAWTRCQRLPADQVHLHRRPTSWHTQYAAAKIPQSSPLVCGVLGTRDVHGNPISIPCSGNPKGHQIVFPTYRPSTLHGDSYSAVLCRRRRTTVSDV